MTQTPKASKPAPRVINVDKNAAYPKAMADLKALGILPESCELTFASNISTIWSNKITASSNDASNRGEASFRSKRRGEPCYEVMHMIKKGQMRGIEKGDSLGQIAFISGLFAVAA